MDQILHLLEYLGITPKQLVPALLVGGLFLFIVYKWLVKDIRQTVGILTDEARDLHNAAKEMQLHLAGNGDFSAQHSLADRPEMDVVKEYVVNHPDEQLELLFGVASWVIRDDYEKYKKQRPPD